MQPKKAGMKYVWGLAAPLLGYELLGLAAAVLFSPLGISSLGVTFLSSLVCIPVFWNLYRKDRERQMLSMEGCIPVEAYYVVWSVSATAALAFVSSQILNMTGLPEWSRSFQQVNHSIETDSLQMQILTAVLAAPVAEELLMRGVLYGRLRERMSAKAAIFSSAVLFGIFHGNVVQFIHALVVGIFLAWLMERFRDIRVPILAHMAANLGSLVLVPRENTTEYVLGLAVCLACVGRTVQILKK